MYAHRLLVLPFLISICVAPVAAQSSSDTTSSSASVCPASKCSGDIRFQLYVPFHWDRNGPTEHSSAIIPPLQLHAIPPLEGALGPTLAQSDVCYSIRGYRVTRDDPASDSTRPAGYSTCQPATRFDVKDAGDLREIVPR